ncbi:MAG: hypothetical protein SLAVMIC_00146 [uncultured marine phage]|uniref:Uncharacterized protein n=1 Tax=uncultured marine phage TaxID=707152 RepID=A0A8D9FQI1_9VIRU|nr:MAG: hypothetical protein SLAVMIC_00146 [uncultured marine phage]
MIHLLEYLTSSHPMVTIILMIVAWALLLKNPKSEVVRQRQMDNWGVIGYKVWWKIMTFQKSNNRSDHSDRIYIGSMVLFITVGSILVLIANIMSLV